MLDYVRTNKQLHKKVKIRTSDYVCVNQSELNDYYEAQIN